MDSGLNRLTIRPSRTILSPLWIVIWSLLLFGPGPRRRGAMALAAASKATARRRPCALVTGATDGIGLTTARTLARRGHDVLVHGRDAARVARAVAAVRAACADDDHTHTVVGLPPVDLSTVAGAAQLAEEVKRTCREQDLWLSVVMNNAGVFAESHVLTEDGLELTFAVNVAATFVVTSLLLPLLLELQQKRTTEGEVDSPEARIVIASSISQSGAVRDWDDLQFGRRPYSAHAAYSESKLLDAMLAMEFSARLARARDPATGAVVGSAVTCNCLDPGTVNTKMLLAGWGPCGIPVEEARDEAWLCAAPELRGVSGRYFVHRTERPASRAAHDAGERRKLWSRLAGLAPAAAAVWDRLDS